MRTGTIISAAGHAAIIALAVFGLPWLAPRERDAIPVTEVSFVTEAEFEAAQQAAIAAREEAGAAPRVVLPPEEIEVPEPPPAAEDAREPEEVAPEEPSQEVATLAPDFDPEAPLRAPAPEVANAPQSSATPERPTAVATPRARPSLRIDPTPAPPPPEQTTPADEQRLAAAPAPDAAEPVPETPSEAPPEAAPEPVAEPSPQAPLALERSGRPKPRRVAPSRAVASAPAEDRQATIQAAVAEAMASGATPPTPPTAPTEPTGGAASGPPITSAERDGLKFAIQRCWNVPAGLREAEELKITVAAELASNGDLVPASVRLIEPRSAPDGRYQVAYDAARRALIRCSPYTDLPPEKYGQWRSIEVVFNPEGMVSW